MQKLLILLILIVISCKSPDSNQSKLPDTVRNEQKEIKALLDSAVVSDKPMAEFERLLPVIKAYSSVDSTWLTNTAIHVKFKNGGTLTWLSN